MATLSVGKYPKGKGWRVIEETIKNGKRSFRTVPKTAYMALGINPSWSLETAREEIKKLNRKNSQDRNLQKAIIGAAKRVKEEHPLFPPKLLDDFEKLLRATNMGSDKHYQKRLGMWETAQKAIKKVGVEPSLYLQYSKAFYSYFISNMYSLDYCNKLLNLVNAWGRFYSRYKGLFFEGVPNPIGRERSRVIEAYRASQTQRFGGSEPLTPDMLEQARFALSQIEYNWLYCSIWLGLRPEEIENPEFSVYQDKNHGVKVLRIWQSKVNLWKHIPVLYPEQEKALEYLAPMKRPNNRRLKKVFNRKKLTCYGGRKGFQRLMQSKGETLIDISKWLGHTSIRTTQEHYEDRDMLTLSRPVKAG